MSLLLPPYHFIMTITMTTTFLPHCLDFLSTSFTTTPTTRKCGVELSFLSPSLFPLLKQYFVSFVPFSVQFPQFTTHNIYDFLKYSKHYSLISFLQKEKFSCLYTIYSFFFVFSHFLIPTVKESLEYLYLNSYKTVQRTTFPP